jgi:hypothetical protein
MPPKLEIPPAATFRLRTFKTIGENASINTNAYYTLTISNCIQIYFFLEDPINGDQIKQRKKPRDAWFYQWI